MTEKVQEEIEQPAPSTRTEVPATTTVPTGTETSEEVLEKLESTKADDLTTATDRQGAPVSEPGPPPPVETTLAAADEPTDPRIAPLQAIFPDFDPTVLSSVLDACNGDQERAIEMLLGMSDPNYVAQEMPHPPNQTDLDEQLAHRLMLEEEENAARSGHPPPGGQGQGQIQVPYQPRQRAPRRGPPPPQGGGYPVPTGASGTGQGQGGMGTGTWSGIDTAQVQDQFSKMAETGRKTFSSFFSKVKQKIQEMDKPTDGSDPSNQPVNASEWNQSARQTGYAEADDFTLPSAAPQGTKAQGYTVGHGPFQPPPGPPPKAAAPLPRGGVTIREPTGESRNTGPSSSSSPPPAQIDTSKINLLPKRPVSLANAPAKEDDDDLEYVENPFEDR